MTDLGTVSLHEAAHLLALVSMPHLGAPGGVNVKPVGDQAGFLTWPALPTLPREHAEDGAVVLLAGIAAEEHARGDGAELLSIEEHGSRGDTRNVAELLMRHGIGGDDADALVARATERARAFVREEWKFLHAIAGILEREGELGAEACAAVGEGLREIRAGRAEARADIVRLFAKAGRELLTEKAVERARRAPMPTSRTGRA